MQKKIKNKHRNISYEKYMEKRNADTCFFIIVVLHSVLMQHAAYN